MAKFVGISEKQGSKEPERLQFSTTNVKIKRKVLTTLPEILRKASVSFGHRRLFARNGGTHGLGLKKGEVTMGKCKHCGSETGEGELFCANCGARLEEEKPETVAAKATEEPPGGTAEKAAEAAETEEAEHEEATEPVVREAAAPKEPIQDEAGAEKKDAAEPKETAGHKGTAEPAAEDRTSGAETAEAAAEEGSAGKKKKIGSAALIALAVLGLAIGFGARTVSRNLGSPGERFLAGQFRALSKEAAVLNSAEQVFENGFSSDFQLTTELSDRQVTVLTQRGLFSGPYERILRDGSEARIFIGKKFEKAVLNLELGRGDDPVLQADFFIDPDRLGFRLSKKSDKVYVTRYPEVLQELGSESRLSTSMFADLQFSKELRAATVKRYGKIVAAAINRNNLKTEKRSYRSRVLKPELKHSLEKDYTIYSWEPNAEELERLFRNIADEMEKDRALAAWYDRRQEIGEQFAKASGQHPGRSVRFEDLADRLRDNAETYANRLEDRKFTWKLVTEGSEVRAILLQLDGGDTQIFCYERDTDKGKLYRGIKVFDSVLTEKRDLEKSGYYGTIACRFSWWFRTESFALKYSNVDFKKKSVLGLPCGKYRLLPGGDEDGDGIKFEVRNEGANSLYELKNELGSFTLKATKTGTAALPTGEEENIDDELLDGTTPQRGISKFIGAL